MGREPHCPTCLDWDGIPTDEVLSYGENGVRNNNGAGLEWTSRESGKFWWSSHRRNEIISAHWVYRPYASQGYKK